MTDSTFTEHVIETTGIPFTVREHPTSSTDGSRSLTRMSDWLHSIL
ncbi:MAG TPA: hypothetical protein VNT53_06110 [Pseudolysinimonas sp.]|nr:hypothetical protein [Pseudolysinimonas sp.]